MKGPMDSMSNAKKGNVQSPNHSSNHPNHSSKDVDFSEYVWMGEEMEDFDRKVLEDLYEQEFIEQCFEEMLEEEESEWFYPGNPQHQNEASELAAEMAQLSVHSQQQQQTSTEQKKQGPAGDSCNVESTLNPEAPVFVPRGFVNPEVEQAR